jgi:C4-dicarboxylate transporter
MMSAPSLGVGDVAKFLVAVKSPWAILVATNLVQDLISQAIAEELE